MGLVEALLVLGLLAVVPLGLTLHPVTPRAIPLAVGGGVAAALSLRWEPSAIAFLLAVPWVGLTLVLAARGAWWWLRRSRRIREVVWPAALAYLAVGSVWLALDRLAVEPVGVQQPFVLLTAVHFHYAGFTATLLAALVYRSTVDQAPRLAAGMTAAVVAAPPIVAAGFTFFGPLQVVGATVLTAGLFVLSWLTLRHVVPSVDNVLSRWLLGISSVAVLVPMLLAVQWAVGWNYGTPALSIPSMARTHGVVNAVGFALCGVWAWRRVGYDNGQIEGEIT